MLPFALGSKIDPAEFARSSPFFAHHLNLKLSLNAYSLNSPLTKQELSLHELFDFCANAGFEAVDLAKLMEIISSSNYQGYLPIETLGPGDPSEKVMVYLRQVKKALKAAGLGPG